MYHIGIVSARRPMQTKSCSLPSWRTWLRLLTWVEVRPVDYVPSSCCWCHLMARSSNVVQPSAEAVAIPYGDGVEAVDAEQGTDIEQ